MSAPVSVYRPHCAIEIVLPVLLLVLFIIFIIIINSQWQPYWIPIIIYYM